MRMDLRISAIVFLAWMFCGGIGPDGLVEAQAQTSERGALISNIRTDPASPRTGDKIRLLFKPSEELVRAEITWTINGNVVGSSNYDISHTDMELNHPIKAGDVVVATITPYEAGGSEGKKLEHRFVCGNAPPILTVTNQAIAADGLYTAKVEAKNPQGGPVKLKLEEGPPGLTMDPEGNIRWKVDQRTSGKHSVKVVGEDADGQKTFLTYQVGISWQK